MTTIGRRNLLYGGGSLAAALAAGVVTWRTRSRFSPAPSPTRGIVCRGNASSPVPSPVLPPLHPDALARFVDPLPIPAVAQAKEMRADPDGRPARLAFYRVSMREAEMRIHRDVPPTRVWSYDGAVPGPTFETRSGQGLLVEWANDLPAKHFLPIDRTLHGAHDDQPDVRTAVHVHGARVPAKSDGYPEDWFTPGRSALAHYPNEQDAATLWYHDHAMGIERLNQYAGLLGLFLVRDELEDALELPSGPHEVPLILFDRLFHANGALHYPTSERPDAPWISELRGDALLVNGKLFPFLDVEPRAYRFRVVNAANSRFYDLSLSNKHPFVQIGSDQGLLPGPVDTPHVSLAPGERADLLVDFGSSAGESLTLRAGVQDLMQFRVARGAGVKMRALPAKLRPIPRIAESDASVRRALSLDEYEHPTTKRMLMLLDGKYWKDPVSETPRLGSVEIWSFVNTTEDTHPIHLHLVRFQILDRQPFDVDTLQTTGQMRTIGKAVPPEPAEQGWKDTVQAYPSTITRIAVRFEGYAGRYVWHCHVLEHAANEMMRPFDVVAGA